MDKKTKAEYTATLQQLSENFAHLMNYSDEYCFKITADVPGKEVVLIATTQELRDLIIKSEIKIKIEMERQEDKEK